MQDRIKINIKKLMEEERFDNVLTVILAEEDINNLRVCKHLVCRDTINKKQGIILFFTTRDKIEEFVEKVRI
jgi:hypothetical protein